MAEVLHNNLVEIEASDIHSRLGLEKGKYILLSAHREENIDTEKNFLRFSYTEEVTLTKTPVKEQVICSVDLGINTDAVCTIMRADVNPQT